MSRKQTLKGSLRIGGYSGSDSGIRIELVDELSHCVVVSGTLTYEEFGKVIANMSGKCEFFHNASGLIGMKAENKTEIVAFENPSFAREGPKLKAAMDKALKPFEVDGWKGDRDDMLNHHRRVTGGYRVIFRRHVPAKETPHV